MANKKDLVNCPHCGILVKVEKLKIHTLLKCKKVVEMRASSKTKTSPSLHIHKTIKHVTKAIVSSMPAGWLKNSNRTAEEFRALYAGKPLPVKIERVEVNQIENNLVNVCCIFCKIQVKDKNLNKHYNKIHNTSTQSHHDLSNEKELETFDDRWLRLFSDKGYSIAMVEAYKREAVKHHLTLKEQADFLEIVKLSKKLIIENHTQNPVDTSITLNNTTEAANDDKGLLRPVVTNEKGYKIDIQTTGRDTANQAAFRKAVSTNFDHCCAITGDCIAVEACHIQTHSDHYDNCVDNGIMLGVGLHRFFDAGIMIINPDSMTVSFMQDCFYKKHLEGAPVRQGKIPINKDKLKAKNLCID